MTLCEQMEPMHGEVGIATRLTIVFSLVFLPCLKWPGNLPKEKHCFWSRLLLSLSCHWLLLQDLFIWNLLLICLQNSLQDFFFCDRDAFNKGFLWVLFIVLLWLVRLFVCSERLSQMSALTILCNRIIQTFSRRTSVNPSFTKHFLREHFVSDAMLVIKDALASSKI